MANDRNDRYRNRDDFASRGYGSDNNRNAFRDRDSGSNRDYGAREDYSRREYGGGDFFGSNRDDYASRDRSGDGNYGFGGRGGYDEFPRKDYGAMDDRTPSYSNQGSSSYYGGGDRDQGRSSYGDRGDRGDRSYGGNRSSFGDQSSSRSYGGGERGAAQGGRGFWDKASDEVSSWFGDRDAERRRDQDQHRGRGPKGYTRSDDRIRDDINDRLTDDGWLDASDIEVAVSNREVTLTGTVSDRDGKRRAEDVAETVSGVSHVQNNIRVKSKDPTSTDVDIDRTANATVAKTGMGGMR